MTVKELIDELKVYNGDMEVRIEGCCHDCNQNIDYVRFYKEKNIKNEHFEYIELSSSGNYK